MTRARQDDLAERTSSGLDVRQHIVPVVRRWLAGGISMANLRSSVRIEELDELAGGLKSPVVGAMGVKVDIIIKQGSRELLLHHTLMNHVNSLAKERKPKNVQDAVFPEVMAVERIRGLGADRNHLMIQQSLVKHDSVQSLLYARGKKRERAITAVRSGLPALHFIHSLERTGRTGIGKLPDVRDPFSERLATRLKKLRGEVRWLDPAFRRGIVVEGLELPALSRVLAELKRWQTARAHDVNLRLVHGDPHLANLMARPRGRGQSVRWIDPNPLWGFSDPAYDWGKLLHFVEPVGWAKESAKKIRIRVTDPDGRPSIRTSLAGVAKTIEKARAQIETLVREEALYALANGPSPEAALELAIASAHVGFAAIEPNDSLDATKRRDAERQRDFALAHTLHALARWWHARGQ